MDELVCYIRIMHLESRNGLNYPGAQRLGLGMTASTFWVTRASNSILSHYFYVHPGLLAFMTPFSSQKYLRIRALALYLPDVIFFRLTTGPFRDSVPMLPSNEKR